MPVDTAWTGKSRLFELRFAKDSWRPGGQRLAKTCSRRPTQGRGTLAPGKAGLLPKEMVANEYP